MIIEALSEHVERAKKDMGDRTRTVGASEVGLCERRIWYAKKGRGHEPVVGSWGAYFRGVTMEEAFWQPALKAKFGDALVYSGADQVNLRLGQLSATPDGFLTGLKRSALAHLGIKDIGSSCIMVECKSIDPRADLQKEKLEHHFQVQVQMGLARDPKADWWQGPRLAERLRVKPNYALISYTDASFWDEVEEFAVRFDPKVYEVAKTRAAKVFGATDPNEMKPEGWIAGGRECEYCPFSKPCGREMRRLPTGREVRLPDPQFAAEIEDLCRDAKRHQKAGKSEEVKFKELQVEIKNRLRDKGVRRVPGVVSWSPVAGRKGYDMEALRSKLEEVGVNLGDFETHGAESDRLVIS